MLLRLSRFLIVIALAGSIGLHWTLLQPVAWVGMIVSYSQDAPLAEALAKTFDGKHPCFLCKQIARGRQSEKKSDLQIRGKKLEFLDSRADFVFSAPAAFRLLPACNGSYVGQSETPPVPPPRQFPG